MEGENEKGFVIKDRRTFDDKTGEARPVADLQNDNAEKAFEARDKATSQSESAQLPEVSFSTFVFSLSSSALFNLGAIPEPNTGKVEKNLLIAKHTIDVLAMLEEKTKGNLSNDERELLTNILYDLRMRYVSETG